MGQNCKIFTKNFFLLKMVFLCLFLIKFWQVLYFLNKILKFLIKIFFSLYLFKMSKSFKIQLKTDRKKSFLINFWFVKNLLFWPIVKNLICLKLLLAVSLVTLGQKYAKFGLRYCDQVDQFIAGIYWKYHYGPISQKRAWWIFFFSSFHFFYLWGVLKRCQHNFFKLKTTILPRIQHSEYYSNSSARSH